MTDEQFEKELEDISKEIEQDEQEQKTVDEKQIDDRLQEMGFLWDRVHEKLRKDNICFHTKKQLIKDGQDSKDVKVHVLEASGAQPGVVAFVSVSDEALQLIKEKEEKEKDNETKKDDE